MKQVNINVVILSLIIFAAALIKGRTKAGASVPAAAPVTLSSKASALATRPGAAGPSVIQKLDIQTEMNKSRHETLKPVSPAVESDLKRFSVLKSKERLTPAEVREKENMLKNDALLRGLQKILSHTPGTPEEAARQNQALDLLLDALHSGHSEVALDVIRSAVIGGGLDDEMMLETAAGSGSGGAEETRAEAMEPWSSLKDGRGGDTAEEATMLPGPANERLWREVVPEVEASTPKAAKLGH